MIAIGSDHAGFDLKEYIKRAMSAKGIEYKDCGCFLRDIRCSYSEMAVEPCIAVQNHECASAILICGTGIGISIAANKHKGIRAALCGDVSAAKLARQHNNANVLCLGARTIEAETAGEIVESFLNTEFEGGRHQSRIDFIAKIEHNRDHTPSPVVFDHPLIQHKLSLIRDKNTGSKEFREMIGEISMLMCYEATRDLALTEIIVETPVAPIKTEVLSGKKLAIVPILRAGIGMSDAILQMIPAAKVGHIGVFRDPDTCLPVEYFCKLPSDISERVVIVLDPMLATGGSATSAITQIKKRGAVDIRFMCIIAAPEGIEMLRNTHPDVTIYCAAMDECLNEHKYIVPGLGDAGDRIFGTN